MTKETVKKILVIFILLIVTSGVFFLIDFNMVAQNKKPMFCIVKNAYDDGGTVEYMGLFYKVFDYHILNGKQRVEFGTWFSSYNEN